MSPDAFRLTTSRRRFVALSIAGLVAARSIPVLADGTYDKGEKLEGGSYGGDHVFKWGTYAVPVATTVYQYATGDDGKAYYTTYDGSAWSGWQGWDGQPADVTYDPAPVAYEDASHTFYTGKGGELYHVEDTEWTDVAADYSFATAPYASANGDWVHLYGGASDGNYYHKAYSTATGWDEWVPVNESGKGKPEAKPYAVAWDDYDNVFWNGDDGKIYWNRYSNADGTWTGAKEIPGDYTFSTAPYAVGYEPESKLYAYATTTDGKAAYNVFDGKAWAGWEAWETDWAATYQPSAYVYGDVQHVAYTADDGKAYYTTYGTEGWAGEWYDLGGNYGYDTDQYEYDETLYLTYTGKDGDIYYKTYADGAGAIDPTPTPEDGY